MQAILLTNKTKIINNQFITLQGSLEDQVLLLRFCYYFVGYTLRFSYSCCIFFLEN
jgi:hypothetical protein